MGEVITPEQGKQEMRELVRSQGGGSDKELDHVRADEILLGVLRSHGEYELSDLFGQLSKWYA